MAYVLVETLATERRGRTMWFGGMTAIGPMTTADNGERVEFTSEEAARRCPALLHPLSFYEVQEA